MIFRCVRGQEAFYMSENLQVDAKFREEYSIKYAYLNLC